MAERHYLDLRSSLRYRPQRRSYRRPRYSGKRCSVAAAALYNMLELSRSWSRLVRYRVHLAHPSYRFLRYYYYYYYYYYYFFFFFLSFILAFLLYFIYFNHIFYIYASEYVFIFCWLLCNAPIRFVIHQIYFHFYYCYYYYFVIRCVCLIVSTLVPHFYFAFLRFSRCIIDRSSLSLSLYFSFFLFNAIAQSKISHSANKLDFHGTSRIFVCA